MKFSEFLEDVNQHLSLYQSLDEDSAKEIIEYVRGKVSPLFIKCVYEHLSVLGTHASFRLVFSTNRFKANFDLPLVRRANGLILAVETGENGGIHCRPLVIPPNEFNPKFSQTNLVKQIGQGLYQVYPAQDGTILNLYYFRGKWNFSSKNTFNIENMVWRGYPYQKIIDDVLTQYSFDYAKLDPCKSYTIGFKHPAFHPFGQPRRWKAGDFTAPNPGWLRSAWLIQSSDGEKINLKEEIGLPLQTPLDLGDNLVGVFQKLGEPLQVSLEKIKNPAPTAEPPFLGLILRSKDENQTLGLSDIILESPLWAEIRRLIYQLPYISNKAVREKQSENFKNMDHIILSSFIDFRYRAIFLAIFPQYLDHYQKYNYFADKTVELIYTELMNLRNKNFRTVNTRNFDENNLDQKIVYALFQRFFELVKNAYSVKPEPKSANDRKTDKKNIKNLLLNPKYTEIFYEILYRENNLKL